MYVNQKRVVRKHKTWKKCRHDQNGFAFYKEKKLTVLSTDAFLNMARNTCWLRLFLFSPSKSVVPRVHFVRLVLHLNKGIDTQEVRIALKSNKFQAFRQALEEITQRQVISLKIGAFSWVSFHGTLCCLQLKVTYLLILADSIKDVTAQIEQYWDRPFSSGNQRSPHRAPFSARPQPSSHQQRSVEGKQCQVQHSLINWVSTTTCFILSNLACSSFSASFNSASFSLTLKTQFVKSNSEDTTETIPQKSIINNTPRTWEQTSASSPPPSLEETASETRASLYTSPRSCSPKAQRETISCL